MGKILITTGQDAANIVKKSIKDLNDLELLILPISIAAFINEDLLRKGLKSINIKEFDFILIPGLIKGSFNKLEKELDIPIFKGPRYATDIPLAIKMKDKLSRKKSADHVFMEKDLDLINEIIKKPVQGSKYFSLGKGEFKIYVGDQSFPIIIAEIVDAPSRPLEEIAKISRYYIKNGANVIDIGAEVKKSQPEKIYDIISFLKTQKGLKNVPISIDSLNEKEILSGIDAGAELILSIDSGNIEVLNNIDKQKALVVLPTNIKEGMMPKSPKQRAHSLLTIIERVQEKDFNNVIGDPLLESPIFPGIFQSLVSYSIFRKSDRNTPLMFGIGNVTELIDSDTAGVNALMASIGMELGVNAYLTTEYSVKSRYSVKELSIALKMAYLAKRRNSPPKDMPLNLLNSKSKSNNLPHPEIDGKEIIFVNEEIESYVPDKLGFFQIWVDHEIKKIYVAHFKSKSEINKIFSGTSAQSLGKKIISMNLVSNKSHVLYLGNELGKAETCLFLGKTYVQDIKFGELP
ncbi:MAG: dihydropteroate synthase-like protein [Candidatus Helarchaeota archaeon]